VSFFPTREITVDAALRDLAGGSTRAKLVAAQALGDVGRADRARVRPALCAALEDDTAAVRAEAASALGEVAAGDDGAPPDEATVAALCRRLDDGAAAVRQAAAISLGTLRAAGGFTALVAALRDGAADLRFQAATSLVEIDPLAAFAPLADAVADPDPQVVGAVALGLGATGDARAPALLARLLDHADAGARFDAAYALAQLGDRRGADVLRAALTDSERDWDAVIALEQLGADSAPALAALLDRRGISPEVQTRAAAAIVAVVDGVDGDHGDGVDVDVVDVAARARAYLVAALDARRLPVRGLAVDELARVGGAWALGPLAALARRRRGRDLAPAIAQAQASIRERLGEIEP
jgi:HEAT repeat protein